MAEVLARRAGTSRQQLVGTGRKSPLENQKSLEIGVDSRPTVCYLHGLFSGPRPAEFASARVHSSRLNSLRRGCIAQLVEQLTLNQRVQGSSPCAPTNLFKGSGGFWEFHSRNTTNATILLVSSPAYWPGAASPVAGRPGQSHRRPAIHHLAVSDSGAIVFSLAAR
ncbi:MAG: hypothetical protein K0S56_4787 [Microvirga sp.]|nr:hypothetical protein [Microvirga sp.]